MSQLQKKFRTAPHTTPAGRTVERNGFLGVPDYYQDEAARRFELVLEQLEDDLALTMRLIGDSAADVQHRVDESVDLVTRVNDFGDDLVVRSAGAESQVEALGLSSEPAPLVQEGTPHPMLAAAAQIQGVHAQALQLADQGTRILAAMSEIEHGGSVMMRAAWESSIGHTKGTPCTELARQAQGASDLMRQQLAVLRHTAERQQRALHEMVDQLRRAAPALHGVGEVIKRNDALEKQVRDLTGASRTFIHEASEHAVSMKLAAESAINASRKAGKSSANMEAALMRLKNRTMAVLRQSIEGERRRFERIPFMAHASFAVGPLRYDLHTLDISLGGALVDLPRGGIADNTVGVVEIDGIGCVQARVQGSSAEGMHLMFLGLGETTASAIERQIQATHEDNQHIIGLTLAAARSLTWTFEEGMVRGDVAANQLITTRYTKIRGTEPAQYSTPALAYYERILPEILARTKATHPNCVVAIACDRNAYIPVHHPEYSKPQIPGEFEWNDVNARNKRIMDRSRMLMAARNRGKYMLQVFHRHMSTGEYVPTKVISAPIFINDQLWGNFQMGFLFGDKKGPDLSRPSP